VICQFLKSFELHDLIFRQVRHGVGQWNKFAIDSPSQMNFIFIPINKNDSLRSSLGFCFCGYLWSSPKHHTCWKVEQEYGVAKAMHRSSEDVSQIGELYNQLTAQQPSPWPCGNLSAAERNVKIVFVWDTIFFPFFQCLLAAVG